MSNMKCPQSKEIGRTINLNGMKLQEERRQIPKECRSKLCKYNNYGEYNTDPNSKPYNNLQKLT